MIVINFHKWNKNSTPGIFRDSSNDTRQRQEWTTSHHRLPRTPQGSSSGSPGPTGTHQEEASETSCSPPPFRDASGFQCSDYFLDFEKKTWRCDTPSNSSIPRSLEVIKTSCEQCKKKICETHNVHKYSVARTKRPSNLRKVIAKTRLPVFHNITLLRLGSCETRQGDTSIFWRIWAWFWHTN